MIATDLTASEETELRNYMNKKITKGTLIQGAGVVASVSLQLVSILDFDVNYK